MTINAPFESFRITPEMTLRNRIVMAPMTTWAGNADATISDEEIAYYERRAKSVGMVITGCSHVSPNGIGFTDEFASYDDRFVASLKRLATAAKSGGAPALLQLFHAGNKADPNLTPQGEVVSASDGLTESGPFCKGEVSPRALRKEEILAVIADFGRATRRAIEAGFDGVELHGAHGFLIQNFLSPHFNRRTDDWGGTLEKRMRFPLAVVAEARRVISKHTDRPFIVGYRISPEEHQVDGLRIDESYVLIDRLIGAGIDYLHVSLTSVLTSKPVAGGDVTMAKLLLNQVADRIPMIAAGQIRTRKQAEDALRIGLPLVAVGQGLVMNPDWIEKAVAGEDVRLALSLLPSDTGALTIPSKLGRIIEKTPGWFSISPSQRPQITVRETL